MTVEEKGWEMADHAMATMAQKKREGK